MSSLASRRVVSTEHLATQSQARAKTLRGVVSLAWPIAITMLGDTAMGLVDTKLVSGLGTPQLGGVGIATVVMWLNYSIVFGLMRGVKVRTAYAVGEGVPHRGTRYAIAGAGIGLLAGVVIWLLARNTTWVWRGLGADATTIPYASQFLAARTFGAPAICVVTALVQHRQGLGDSRTPMLVQLFGNIVNAILAYGLIYGRFGLPALGVAGAGYGTSIAESLELVALATLLYRTNRTASPGVDRLSLRGAAREVADLGIPTGLQFGLEVLAFTAFTAILSGISASEVAAHQVALAILRTSFLPGVAVSEASSVLVGKALGERRIDEADRVVRSAVTVAVMFMTACGVVFALGGGAIGGLFSHDPTVVHKVRLLLLVAALFQTLDAVTIVLRGSLRGAQDVRMVAAIGITVTWICVPSAAIILGRWAHYGAVGGWCGFVAETSISAGVYWWRWRRGPWRAAFTKGVC